MPASASRNRASHERILEAAIGEFFTEDAFLEVVEGTVDQDSLWHQGLTARATAEHGMMSPFPNADSAAAVALRDGKIARQMGQTQLLIAEGKAQAARNKFGRATHTIQDKYPHAHTAGADGKDPLPWNPLSPVRVVRHVLSDAEEVMGSPNVKAAIKETRAAYEQLEVGVLKVPLAPADRTFTPLVPTYDAFLKFRGILVRSEEQRAPYLKWDQGRWADRKVTK